MYCSQLSTLNNFLGEDEINKLDTFLYGLTGGTRKQITVSKVAEGINVSFELATRILIACYKTNILGMRYALICDACGMLVKDFNGIEEVPFGNEICCYDCGNNINVDEKNIVLLFSLNEDLFPFREGLNTNQTVREVSIEPRKEDSLEAMTKVAENILQIFLENQQREQEYKQSQNELYSKAYLKYKKHVWGQLAINILTISVFAFLVYGVLCRYRDSLILSTIITCVIQFFTMGVGYITSRLLPQNIDIIMLKLQNDGK